MNKRFKPYMRLLVPALGKAAAQRVLDEAQRHLDAIERENPDLPDAVKFHTNGIFARIAVYQAMQQMMPQEQALQLVQREVWGNAARKGRMIAMLLRFPFLRKPLLRIFHKVTVSMFGEEAGFKTCFHEASGSSLRFDITRCPYHDFFCKYDCPELNCVSCKADEYTYGNLPGITFARTMTLGENKEKCDFHLFLKSDQ